MEVVQSKGLSVFLERGDVVQDTLWSSRSASGYWLGLILSGDVEICQNDRIGGSFTGGDGVVFGSDKPLETTHRATSTGHMSAVFLHVALEYGDEFFGEEAPKLFEGASAHFPEVAQSIGWQMLGNNLQGAARSLFLTGKAMELAAHVLGNQQSGESALSNLAAHDMEAVHEARAILMRELSDPPSVPELARRLGLNATKLTKSFRETFGVTPYAFSKAYRLEQAQYLFGAGETSVSRVAAKLGYQPQHLATEFRRKFGVAPSSLIQRH